MFLAELHYLLHLFLLTSELNLYFAKEVSCEGVAEFNLTELRTALTLTDSSNQTLSDCKWKTLYDVQECTDSGMTFYYYSGKAEQRVEIDPLKKNSLQETLWDPHKHNIIYIHGYGSGDQVFPTKILTNAYVTNGSYNVFTVDWSSFAKTPCYTSAVHNLNAVAKCTGQLYRNIRFQGIPSDRITCVGHSLGAHGCGLVSKHIDFRMYRIIGLDPARLMIPNVSRLTSEMANDVQVIYTNSGTFADTVSNGRVNFCMNGGKIQPVCKNSPIGVNLCSHIISICYLAESIDESTARTARPCARQCPVGPRKGQGPIRPVLIGQHTPDKVSGSYCLSTTEAPYCPKGANQNGHSWCCLNKFFESSQNKVQIGVKESS